MHPRIEPPSSSTKRSSAITETMTQLRRTRHRLRGVFWQLEENGMMPGFMQQPGRSWISPDGTSAM